MENTIDPRLIEFFGTEQRVEETLEIARQISNNKDWNNEMELVNSIVNHPDLNNKEQVYIAYKLGTFLEMTGRLK